MSQFNLDDINTTCVDISLLLSQGQYNAIRMICSVYSTAYMLEVYRRLTKEKKDKLMLVIIGEL